MTKHKEIYRRSFAEAEQAGESALWMLSHGENCRCARAIENGIRQNFDGMNLQMDFIQDVLKEFGFNRVNWVLANTVLNKPEDGRFAPVNRVWAKSFPICPEDKLSEFVVQSHPTLTDGVIHEVRRQWQALGLYEKKHCMPEQNGGSEYLGKVLVIDPTVLDDSRKSREHQLFMATGGFGCSPGKVWQKVSGYFLKDMKEDQFSRKDVIGVIQRHYLPQWAWDQVLPPIRSVIALPGEEAQEMIASTHWDAIRKIIGCDTPTCDGISMGEGLMNLYYDPKGKENGKPFNRRVEDRMYYGPILINGMHQFDKSLSPTEAEEMITRLNQKAIMTPAPEMPELSLHDLEMLCE